MLWAGTLGFQSTLRSRADAAAAAGCTGFSLSSIDVAAAEADGWSAAEIGRWAADRGLALVLDPLVTWHPYEESLPFRYAEIELDETLRMCRELQCRSLTAVAMTDSTIPVAELAAPIGRLCRQVASDGIDVHLEFIPMTVVPTLRVAWDIVRDADEDNGGLLVDSWHFFRGDPDFGLLATVTGERIFAVQVNDADAQPHGSLWDDTRHRQLPGAGSFALGRLLSTIPGVGGPRWIGPEVFSAELAALPGAEAASSAVGCVRSLVDAISG